MGHLLKDIPQTDRNCTAAAPASRASCIPCLLWACRGQQDRLQPAACNQCQVHRIYCTSTPAQPWPCIELWDHGIPRTEMLGSQVPPQLQHPFPKVRLDKQQVLFQLPLTFRVFQKATIKKPSVLKQGHTTAILSSLLSATMAGGTESKTVPQVSSP